MAERAITAVYKNLYADRPHKRKIKPVNLDYLYSEFHRNDSAHANRVVEGQKRQANDSEGDDEDFELSSDAASYSSSSGDNNGSDHPVVIGDTCGHSSSPYHTSPPITSAPLSDASENTLESFLIAWRAKEPDMCCICFDDATTQENPLLYCDGLLCEVCVHLECYGILKLPLEGEEWFCDRCASQTTDVSCVFCPCSYGAFRQLMNGTGWAHILCALWIPNAHFGNDKTYSNIIADYVLPKDWFRECAICQEIGGVTLHCDAGDCRSRVHISCAADWGLLEQLEDNDDMAYPHFVYCPSHPPRKDQKLKRNKWIKWIMIRDNWFLKWLKCSPFVGLERQVQGVPEINTYLTAIHNGVQGILKLNTYILCELAKMKRIQEASTIQKANSINNSLKPKLISTPSTSTKSIVKKLTPLTPSHDVVMRDTESSIYGAEIDKTLKALQSLIDLRHISIDETSNEGIKSPLSIPLNLPDALRLLNAGEMAFSFSTKSLDQFLKCLAVVSNV